jgi:hypothetical protein
MPSQKRGQHPTGLEGGYAMGREIDQGEEWFGN